MTEGRQKVTFAAGCSVSQWIGIPQHTNISLLQPGTAYHCGLVSHSTKVIQLYSACNYAIITCMYNMYK